MGKDRTLWPFPTATLSQRPWCEIWNREGRANHWSLRKTGLYNLLYLTKNIMRQAATMTVTPKAREISIVMSNRGAQCCIFGCKDICIYVCMYVCICVFMYKLTTICNIIPNLLYHIVDVTTLLLFEYLISRVLSYEKWCVSITYQLVHCKCF